MSPDERTMAVKARLMEAAATERRLPRERLGPASARGFWPAVILTEEEARMAAAEPMRVPPSPSAIARWEECIGWPKLVTRRDNLEALRAWYECHVRPGRSFKAWAEEASGVSRTAAYKRVEAACKEIAASLGNDRLLLERTGNIDGLHAPPEAGSSEGKMHDVTPRSPKAWMAPGARPTIDAWRDAAAVTEGNDAQTASS